MATNECKSLKKLFDDFEEVRQQEEEAAGDYTEEMWSNDPAGAVHKGWEEAMNHVTTTIRAVMKKRKCP